MAEFWEPTPEILKQVEGWAAVGMTQEQIADNLGIAPETLSRKKAIYDQLYQALKKGAFTGGTHVANALFQNATVHNNVTAQIFYLKCRLHWNDGSKDEVDNKEVDKFKQSKERAQKCLKEKSTK